ncbi:hypothetical protein F2P81_003324 [Scophthalmus maximus]|uniref:Uncharacterized protein n=1 Tax=Scophthalmus maximus TaxID=52904 RepID=A0A6A4T9C0_SCOMX|nr:hypothetical protein F2P81_003324 [Scophthalmus maximus]
MSGDLIGCLSSGSSSGSPVQFGTESRLMGSQSSQRLSALLDSSCEAEKTHCIDLFYIKQCCLNPAPPGEEATALLADEQQQFSRSGPECWTSNKKRNGLGDAQDQRNGLELRVKVKRQDTNGRRKQQKAQVKKTTHWNLTECLEYELAGDSCEKCGGKHGLRSGVCRIQVLPQFVCKFLNGPGFVNGAS